MLIHKSMLHRIRWGAAVAIGVLTTTLVSACGTPAATSSPAAPSSSAGAQSTPTPVAQQLVTYTDLAGRQVQVKTPTNKVVVSYSGEGGPFLTMLALEQKNVPTKLVAIDHDLQAYRADWWTKFTEQVPGLDKLPDVGAIDLQTFNVEKIVSLQPDVMILPLSTQKSAQPVVDKLAAAGIPTVFIDYHAEKLDSSVQSILLIGKIIGDGQKAQALADYYTAQVQRVSTPLKASTLQKPTIYLEIGSDPAKYGSTYVTGSGWGPLMENAGFNNIAKGKVDNAPLASEYVVSTNPDVIFLTGSYWVADANSVKLGYTANLTTSMPSLAAFMKRPGWNSLSAVKNRRVYSINHGLSRDVWDFYPLQYMAKAIYPDMFKDLDPDANFADFHQKFLGFPVNGLWAMQWDGR